VSRRLVPALLLLLYISRIGYAQTGTIEGTVSSKDGIGINNVTVTLEPNGWRADTDSKGHFEFPELLAGKYTVRMISDNLEATIEVVVNSNETQRVDKIFPEDFHLEITVHVVDRGLNRLLDVPASVVTVDEKAIALEGGAELIPELLQSKAGSEYTQSGVYDIQFNSRGFNATLSRRVAVQLDGRDLAAPENKNQEWITYGFLTPEIDNFEFMRGPAAALYGANSINGVISLTSKPPSRKPEGRVSITTGNLGTVIGDFRISGPLGHKWFGKLVVNHTTGGSFTKSRTNSVEYPGLPLEIAEPADDVHATAFDARVDKDLGEGRLLVLEGGYSKSEGGTYLSQGGRFNVVDSKRSWSRAQFNTSHWMAHVYLNTRDGATDALYAPVRYPTSTQQFKGEWQGHAAFAHGRGRAVFGGSYLQEHADSADSNGVQRLYMHEVTTKEPALYGNVDFQLRSNLIVGGALRWDESTLHTSQISPRASIVYKMADNHSLHFNFSRGFEVGNYNELYVNTPIAPPYDLSQLEVALAPVLGGTSLGFSSVPVLAIGNPNLDVEKIETFEAGYRGKLGSRLSLSAAVYRSRMRDFITDILPGVNPAFPPYKAPAQLPDVSRAIVEQVVNKILGMTNLANGDPAIVYSLGNVGLVNTRGAEGDVGFNLGKGWSLDSSYTWFDFTLDESQPGFQPKPNAPRNRVTASVTYVRNRFSASFHYRWVDDFTWASGLFVGPVPNYNTSSLNAYVLLTKQWKLGTNIANVFNQPHYEMFGGDLLGRRALVSLSFTW